MWAKWTEEIAAEKGLLIVENKNPARMLGYVEQYQALNRYCNCRQASFNYVIGQEGEDDFVCNID